MPSVTSIPLPLLLVLLLVLTAAPSAAVQSFYPNHNLWSKTPRWKCIRLPNLTCRVRATAGNRVVGTVTFSSIFQTFNKSRDRCSVLIEARVFRLRPGAHGFHIHVFGDVRAVDGTSAGGHFTRPDGTDIEHGSPDSPTRHWGDLGNLMADGRGIARYSRIDKVVSLAGVLGRGIVIHEAEDMGADEQPTGAAGSRQASCVIGFANPDL